MRPSRRVLSYRTSTAVPCARPALLENVGHLFFWELRAPMAELVSAFALSAAIPSG